MGSLLRTLALVVPLLPWPAAAQETPARPAASALEPDEASEARVNEAALVVAGTREPEGDEHETSLTIGAEYERRLTRRLGVVAEIEYVSGPGSWIVAAPVVVHLPRGVKLFTGPGFEHAPVDDAETSESDTA